MYSVARIVVNSKFLDLSYRPFGGSDEGVRGGARRRLPTGCSGLHVGRGVVVTATQWPTSVVVVSSGCPVRCLRCLRRDMAAALVV